MKWSCFEGVIFGFLRGCVFLGVSYVFVRDHVVIERGGSCVYEVRVFGTYGCVLTSSQHHTGVRSIGAGRDGSDDDGAVRDGVRLAVAVAETARC